MLRWYLALAGIGVLTLLAAITTRKKPSGGPDHVSEAWMADHIYTQGHQGWHP